MIVAEFEKLTSFEKAVILLLEQILKTLKSYEDS